MKKLLFLFAIILTLIPGISMALPPAPGMPVVDTNCNQSKYFAIGTLCQDSDDGKLYKGTGAAVVELAAGASGDMTLATYDAGVDGKIDTAAGGTGINTSASTGTAYVTGGTWSIKSAANEMTALGLTANAQSLVTAADYAAMKVLLALTIGTNVQAWDADLDYLATFTPTANVKTLLNAANFAAIQASLSVDDLITLSGVAEGVVNLGTFTGVTIADSVTTKAALQALETALEIYDVDHNGKIDGNKLENISATDITTGTLTLSAFNLPSSVSNPGTTTGQIKHDSNDTDLSATGGIVKWYDGTDVRSIIDTKALASPGTLTAYMVSLLASGRVDGTVGMVISTADSPTTVTVASHGKHSYFMNIGNSDANSIFTLPTAAAGIQYCFKNYTGISRVLTLQTSAAGQYIDNDGTLTATGGFVHTGGAAGDGACVVGVDATHWVLYVNKGTWSND